MTGSPKPAHHRSAGSQRWPGRCAYCGKDGADEPDHVIPGCLYARGWTPGEYLTVPSHGKCNRSFSADEEAFREDISTAGGNAAAAATRNVVLRSFGRAPGRGWQLLARLSEGRIYPIRNPATVRVLRKVVRGLAFYHGLLISVPDDLIKLSPTRFEIPPAFIRDARIREVRHPDVFQCLGFIIDDLGDVEPKPRDAHSFWRLKFYDRVQFDAWIARAQ